MSEPSFKDCIVGFGRKPADQFAANPRNPRKHPQRQRDAVRASLGKVGWVGVVMENIRTGYVIDGHERIWQALDTNSEVPYIQVDIDESEEALVLATFDPLTYMADTDPDMLANLLNQAEAEFPDMSGLLEAVADQMGGEILSGEHKNFMLMNEEFIYRVIVECDNDAQQRILLARFQAEGLRCQALIS